MQPSLRVRAALRLSLRAAGGVTRRVSRLLARAEAGLADPALLTEERRGRIRSAMRGHDMVIDPDEGYYRDRYWSWIDAELTRRVVNLGGSFLDAGCGSGRLTLPLAAAVAPHGGRVTGIDLLPESIESARGHARERGLDNVSLHDGDLLEFLAAQPPESFEAALFLEVGYQVLDLPGHLRQLRRVLRPRGLLLASFRTQYFLALLGVANREWDLAAEVLRSRSGPLRGMGWQNWHSAADAAAQLEECGFSDVRLAGLGPLSGITGDPLASVARPSMLGAAELEALAELETALGAAHPDTGRYLLASAVRP